MEQIVFVLAAIFSVVLWTMYRRHHRQAMQARAMLLDNSDKVIAIKRSQVDRAGFRHVSGEFDGTAVSLKLEVDNLTARRLPVMWLHLTMLRPSDSTGSLDMLMRPQSGDAFSPGWDWSQMVTPLKNWPEHARYVSENSPPDLQSIDSDVRTIFADQRAKEVLITPQAVRLTYLIRQADRGNYLLMRNAEFDLQPVDSAEIAALTRQLHRLVNNLDGEVCDAAA